MKLSELSVKRPVAAAMILLALVIVGSVSLFKLPVELFPRMTFPIAAVTLQARGTGTEVLEKMAVRPLEEMLGTTEHVRNISSTTRSGGALILVEYDWGTDMDFATLQMREKIDYIRNLLPKTLDTPLVLRFDPNLLPVMQIGLTGGRDLNELQTLANDTIKRRLSRVEGVASVQIAGGAERIVQITANPLYLQARGLTLDSLRQILASENLTLSGGTVREGGRDLTLLVRGEFSSVEAMRGLPLASPDGQRFHLRDVATVEEVVQPAAQSSRMNGQPAVSLSIQKRSDANAVAISNGVQAAIRELQATLPSTVTITPLFDQATFIKQSVTTLVRDMILGGLFAVLILFLFLRSWRSTLVISLAIPVSIIATFVMVYFAGQSVNMLTMGGLALGVGAMVDTAVVILENIFRHRQMGRPLYDAVLEGSSEVSLAVTSAAFASVVVFAPILFVSGLAAQLFRPLALTVTFSHLASLFSALLLVPMFAYYFLRGEKKEVNERPLSPALHDHETVGPLSVWYGHLLRYAVHHRKTVFLTTLALMVATCALYPLLGKEFLPKGDQGVIQVTVNLPPGSPLDKTGQTATDVEKTLHAVREVDTIFTTVGGGNMFNPMADVQTQKAILNIQLKPHDARTRSTVAVADDIRNRLRIVPGARINVQVTGGDLMSGGAGLPIQIRLRGDDPDMLRKLAEKAVQEIGHVAGVREPSADREALTQQVEITVNREKALSYGLGTAQVALAVQQAMQGTTATQFRTQGNERDVRLQIPATMRGSLERLRQLPLSSPLGTPVVLGSIADVQVVEGPSAISHYNNLREMTVEADYLGRDLGHVMDDIKGRLATHVQLPVGYSVEYGGESERMADAFTKLAGALVLAVVLVYMVMAAQFESFFHPFVIMFSVPVTAVGVVFGLLVTGRSLGVGAFIGVIVLVGIVVNNAIILVDYINRLRKSGYDRVEAILRAGPVRLRPILMTAGATVLGVVPASLGIGEGAEIQAPLATVILFGLLFSTLITLVLVPVVYLTLDLFVERWKTRKLGGADL